MHPYILYETLRDDTVLQGLGISSDRIKELQSCRAKPFADGEFLVMNMQDQEYHKIVNRGPRIFRLACHRSTTGGYDYTTINQILGQATKALEALIQATGTDNMRVSMVEKITASANLEDEGWDTIYRDVTFRVLYDDSQG